MILTGRAIETEVKNGSIKIDPFNGKQLNPNSYNLRLHENLLVYSDEILDMKRANVTKQLKIPKEGLVLMPGMLYLGRTVERAGSDAFIPMLEGRSSIGRLGMSIHTTASMGQLGFQGFWTLEITVVHPLKVYPNVEVCQVYFHEYKGISTLYGEDAKYQENNGIQPSGLWKEF